MTKGKVDEARDRVFKLKGKELSELKLWERILSAASVSAKTQNTAAPKSKSAEKSAEQKKEEEEGGVVSRKSKEVIEAPLEPPPNLPSSPILSPIISSKKKTNGAQENPPPSVRVAPSVRPPVPAPRPPPRRVAFPPECEECLSKLKSLEKKISETDDIILVEEADEFLSVLGGLRDVMVPLHVQYRTEGYMEECVAVWRQLNVDLPTKINSATERLLQMAADEGVESCIESEIIIPASTPPEWGSSDELSDE